MTTTRQGPPPIPRHMRRDRFAPLPETQAARDEPDFPEFRTAFGARARLVTRYADVREVLGDAERFSNTGLPRLPTPDGEEGTDPRAGNLLATDPPEHTRLRRLLTGEFTVKRIRRLEPRITEIVDDHLDAMAAAGRQAARSEGEPARRRPYTDLVSAFALPVPSLVICELLGVPYDDRVEFQGRAARQIDLSRTLEERGRIAAESRAYMGELVDRAKAEPGEDMLGMLVREHGDDITRGELIGIASLLLIAGHETTANMLGLGTLALLREPDQLARVRDEDGAVAPAVEELLRWLSVVHSGVPRVVREDTTVGGRPVAAGEFLVLSLPAANRDPAVVDHPDDLDVTREIAPHVAFGHGVHHCLGAPLARAEMAVAFPALFRRFPTLALDIPFDEVEFRSATVVHGLRALPVTW